MKESSGFWHVPPPDGRELRNYGLLMAAVGFVVAAAFWLGGTVWWETAWWAVDVPGLETGEGSVRFNKNETAVWWATGVALAFLGTALVWRTPLRPIYHVWMLLVAVLGFVSTHFWLALIFYTLFTAIGLVMRILRQDPLALKEFRSAHDSPGHKRSYWERREEPLLPAEHPEHQF